MITLGQLGTVAAGFLDARLHDPGAVAARRIPTLRQYRTPETARLLRKLTVERPLAFQTAVFAGLIRRGKFRPTDPEALVSAFWGLILAILVTAGKLGREPEARRLLGLRLEYFRGARSVSAGRTRGRRRPRGSFRGACRGLPSSRFSQRCPGRLSCWSHRSDSPRCSMTRCSWTGTS